MQNTDNILYNFQKHIKLDFYKSAIQIYVLQNEYIE